MKFFALICLVVVAHAKNSGLSKIGGLKRRVTQGSLFGISGFAAGSPEGRLAVKVDVAHPQKVDLPKEKQIKGWQAVEKDSPLRSMGFVQWMSAEGGLVFKNDKQEQTRCQAMAGEAAEDRTTLLVQFECKATDAKTPRFSAVRYGGDETATTHGDGDPTGLWHSCGAGRVPFGWNTEWGVWDYPYYTVTTQGILGCRTTDADYCTPQNADLFPFSPNLEWSNFIRNPKQIFQKTDGTPLHDYTEHDKKSHHFNTEDNPEHIAAN